MIDNRIVDGTYQIIDLMIDYQLNFYKVRQKYSFWMVEIIQAMDNQYTDGPSHRPSKVSRSKINKTQPIF